MESKFLDTPDGKLHYRTGFDGKVVVLIHGFGEDGNIWINQLSALSNYCVVIPDLPGTGKSDIIGKEKIVQISDYAESIRDILKVEKVDQCVMIGHSMGGYIALAFAEKYQSMLEGLGLVHSSAFADNEDKIATRRKGIEFVREHGAGAFLKTTIPGLYAENFKARSPETVDRHLESVNFTDHALIQYYEAMIARPDRTNVLKRLEVPVLFMIGELDQAIPLEQSLRQCHIPSISHVHILPEVAHMGMIEASDTCNKFILEFLQNIYNTSS